MKCQMRPEAREDKTARSERGVGGRGALRRGGRQALRSRSSSRLSLTGVLAESHEEAAFAQGLRVKREGWLSTREASETATSASTEREP